MKIAICGSLTFTHQFAELQEELEAMGFEVMTPLTSQKILNGDLNLGEVEQMKLDGTFAADVIARDAIRKYYDEVVQSDAILVANYEKKGIPGYIGGNTFLEMGFAHVHHKPIFLLNPLPDLPYRDEMAAMQPAVINGQLEQITHPAKVMAHG